MINKFPIIDFPKGSLLPWLGKTGKMLSLYMRCFFSSHGFDITREQFILLAHLYHKDGMMQKDLAFITERNKGSLARLVNTTEKKNWVARIPSTEDKRVNQIYLTTQGRAIFEKLKPILAKCEQEVQKGLTPQEIEMTISVLEKIQKNISK